MLAKRFTKKSLFVILALFALVNISVYLNYTKPAKTKKQAIVRTVKQKQTTKTTAKTLEICPLIPPDLTGQFDLDYKGFDENEVKRLLKSQSILSGGKWAPKHCIARNHVAILVPYRDRNEHLLHFLLNMHPLFAKQELSYGIYLIEPVKTTTFNRGLLFNIGFLEANKDFNNKWQCYALHDVDLISENDKTLYACPENPTHLSYLISSFNYKPIYKGNFGGVSVLNKKHYENANGFSNLFFGWGGEDDDFRNRVLSQNLTIIKPKAPLGRYRMLKHKKDKPNPQRRKLLKEGHKRFKLEGLTTSSYKLVGVERNLLYTKFIVSYNEKEILSNFNRTQGRA